MLALERRAREVVLTMSNGGRPPGLPPADVSVSLNDRLLGTVRVGEGFKPYTFAALRPKSSFPSLILLTTSEGSRPAFAAI